MRALLVAFILAVFAGPVRSQEQTIPVATQFSATSTCRGVFISSQTPTALTKLPNLGYRKLFIQNISTAYTLAVGDNPQVSTITNSNQLGIFVSSGTPYGGTLTVSLVPGTTWYALNNSATTVSTATVCLGR